MIVGVPKEVKRDEYRVAMLPVGVEELTRAGHSVVIEHGAGLGSGIADERYVEHGARLAASAEEVFAAADMIVKVKEPLPAEWPRLRPGQIVFTYFHFAADRQLTDAMIASGCTAVAYETLRDDRGQLPLLTPMSEVAGRMSIQEGAKYLERPQMGRGILLGGVPGVAPANILILGAGVVGANAAKVAAGFGANIALLDVNMDRLRYLDDVTLPNIDCLFSDRHQIREQLRRADLVIGAVLIPGAKAPRLVEYDDLKLMQPGSVLIDVAIDQGGCVETSRPTTHSEPTYIVEGVVHYCVTNMPGAVGRTSTYALCNVTLPWVLRIAKSGIEEAAAAHKPIARAINICSGRVTNRAVAETFSLPLDSRFDVQVIRDAQVVSAHKAYQLLGNECLWDAAQECHKLLTRAGVPHAIVGGVAVCLHGYQRNTVDLDLLIPVATATSARAALEAGKFIYFQEDARLRSPTGVPVQFLLGDDRAGPGSEVRLPDLSDATVITHLEGLPVVTLARLIESKLACGQGNLRRTHKDFADVVELIAVHRLSRSFARHVHKSLRTTFRELMLHARGGK